MRALHWGACLSSIARRYDAQIAVRDGTSEIRFADLFRKAAALATRLVTAGVRPGEAVVVVVRNGIPAVWASYGVALSGAAEVPINPALSEVDCRHCLALAGATRVVTYRARAPFFRDLGLEVLCVEEVGKADLDAAAFPSVAPDAMARVMFTSGTTGLPKGAVHDQETRWIANLLLRASLPHAPGPGTRLLLMTPFSHGASLMTFAYLERGATVTLLDGVDPERVLPMIGGGEVDEMFAPPTVLAKLVEAAGDRRYRRLKTIFCGTATLMPALYMRAREVFGPVVRVTYGKSEVFNPITVLEAAETDLWYAEGGSDADACVGWPASGVAIDVRTTTGAPARVGEEGEVLIWAQHLMRGYLCLEGYERLRLDRSHDTGDLGYLDERGRLHLTGRIADMIKTGGYKVSPEEVERPMAAALSPSAVAALGIPSDYWGEVIVLAVEKPGRDWSDRAREVASRMTAYKRPRAFLTMDQLPRSGIGKVKRSAIREHVLTAYRLVDGPRPRLEPRERADD